MLTSTARPPAAALAICNLEKSVIVFGFAIEEIGNSLGSWGLCTIWNPAPARRAKGDLARLTVVPDHQEVLARRAVPAGREIVDKPTVCGAVR
jgi:hypothetical protein